MAQHIVALGGGGFSVHERLTQLDRYVLDLCDAAPTVCFVPTASGDSLQYIANFRRSFREAGATLIELTLFDLVEGPPPEIVLDSDLVYVGGGSTANLLALWRLHGLDKLLVEAHRQGTVLAGISAGGLCWFQGGITDSHGELAPLLNGLGLLPGAFCPHYGEPTRQEAMGTFVHESQLDGWAVEDDAALHFVDGALHRAVSDRPDAAAFTVRPGLGSPVARPLAVEYLS